MRLLELSLRNYRVFDEVDLELPSTVIGIFGPNGAGKCLPGWVRLHDADTGESIPIEQFVTERRKRTLGLRDGRIESVDVTEWFDLGPRPTVALTLTSGASFEMAETHPVLTDRGCVRAQDLRPGDWVAESASLPACGPTRLSVDEALILGILLGDGCISRGATLSATEPAVVDAYRDAVERVFPGCTVRPSDAGRRTWIVVSQLSAADRRKRILALGSRLVQCQIPLGAYLGANVYRFLRGEAAPSFEILERIEEDFGIDLYEDRCALFGGRIFLEWVRSLGILGCKAATKHVPDGCLLLPDDQVRALLAGLWMTDGWIQRDNGPVAYGTSSAHLARDVRVLLLRLGITSSLRVQRKGANQAHYRVNLTADGARKFGQVPLLGPKGQQQRGLLQLLNNRRRNPNSDLLPPSFLEELPTRSLSGRERTRKQLARHGMSRELFLDFGGDPSVARSEISWSKVRSIEETGRTVPCFDIAVDTDEHLYLAETLIVHNSSLVESISFALYGRARTPKDQIRTHGILTDCTVRVLFEHGGREYEVRRTIKGKNHQTDAELYAGDLQVAAGVTEVDGEIQRLLRMDQQIFRASVFAEQKQLDAFSDVTKAKRKEMVLRLLGIRPVDDARAAARKEARDTKGNGDRLAGALPDLAEQEKALAEAAARAGEAEERASEAVKALHEAEERGKEGREAFEESDGIRQRVEKLAVERAATAERAESLEGQRVELDTRIADLRRALDSLPALDEEHRALEGAADRLTAARRLIEMADEVRQLETQLADLPEVDAAAALADLEAAEAAREAVREEAHRARSVHERAQDEQSAAKAALERAGAADPSQPCPTCGRPLGDDFRQYLAHCGQEVAEAKRRVREAAAGLRKADEAARAAEDGYRKAVALGEEARKASQARTSLDGQLGKARGRLEELAEPFGEELPDVVLLQEQARRSAEVDRLLAELRTEHKHLLRAEKDLEGVVAELAGCTARIAELDRDAAALAFDPEDHARLRKERDESERLLEQARERERETAASVARAAQEVSRLEGAIAQARETVARVDELRDETRYLERVSLLLDGFRDHLVSRIGPGLSREAESMFRDLTNHEYEDFRIDDETLAIHIADGGRFFPVERFSGSEADLANLALRVAISMHLSRMSGADIGMMVLDEVLGSLDVERKDLFVQAMGRLASRFHQLFVITHAEQVKDQFPASIEVRKVGRRRSTATLV
jgi:exonuclease SbcC